MSKSTKISVRLMPKLSDTENARRDLRAEADFTAGIGIPAEEVFAYLHNRIDGIKTPKPKARKLW
ncbi:MAG: hypothetical protein JZU55_09400 [Afipia sp.]|nr:hypothetical protein [Afipia sp.]